MALDTDQYEYCLRQGLEAMALSLDDKQVEQLLAYLSLFHQWNQAYNLSAIRDPEEIVYRHILDSLSLFPYINQFVNAYNEQRPLKLIDVGTGGGLPGVPLAIAFPRIDVTLLDSNGKKTRFLFQTIVKLGLKNVSVENNRVEKFSPPEKFAIVTSRAFASLQDMINGCKHLLAEQGEYWAMKGQYPTTELTACEGLTKLKACHELSVPGTEGKRHLLILKNDKQ